LTPFSHRLFESFARGLFRFYCPLHVTGRHHVPSTSFIFCSNHASHMDSIALMTATGLPFNRFGMLAASDYFFSSALVHRWFSGMVQLIPISRSPGPTSLQRTLALCRRFLDGQDRSLILFPEGTRSVTGEMGSIKRGVSLISTELGLPIVPAYIEGSGALMPKGRVFPAPGRVGVHIGAPIVPGTGRDHDAVTRRIEDSIRALKNAPRE
jgi:1-acyl-sn-glycerol-3-phosphate acyltransferase